MLIAMLDPAFNQRQRLAGIEDCLFAAKQPVHKDWSNMGPLSFCYLPYYYVG
jgi:hypothetical protein